MPFIRKILTLLISIASLLVILFHNDNIHVQVDLPELPNLRNFRLTKPRILNESDHQGPADSLLGFDVIYATSAPNSTRRRRLLQAANVTEIDIEIPQLPDWSQEELAALLKNLEYYGHDARPGSALAWLSHHEVLQRFLKSGHETALIIEDDMDWDVHLRSVEIPRVAAAARALFQPATGYWGNTEKWDMLWLGHCGDWLHKLEKGIGSGYQSIDNITSRPHLVFEDPTLPDRHDLHPFTRKFLNAIELPEKARVLHQSGWPLCTFAYAVNRRSAKKMLKDIIPVSAPGSFAYDAAMLLGCTKRGLNCYTLNPEIFHHMKGDSIIAALEHPHGEEIFLPPVDKEGLAQAEERNETSNIACGFASGHFRFQDPERMKFLQREVGRNGKCMKPGRNWQNITEVQKNHPGWATPDGEMHDSIRKIKEEQNLGSNSD